MTFRERTATMRLLTTLFVVAFLSQPVVAQTSAPLTTPREWTTAEDHRQMMEQLGITALRPGPSGNEQAPNHANYDASLANPFPVWPSLLTLKNGRQVTTRAQWALRADALKPMFTGILGPPAAVDQAPPATGDPSARRPPGSR